MREMQTKTRHFLTPLFLTSAIAGTVLAILAPLGTDSFTATGRFIYWIGLCLAGGLGAAFAEFIASRIAPTLSRWPIAALQSLGATAIVSLFVIKIDQSSSSAAIVQSLFYIWVIAMTISAVGALQKGKKQKEHIAKLTTPDMAKTEPALMLRLKPALRRGEIYGLEAQDHYVRVITSGGEDLLLMRLSDAAAETTPLKGLSPHRSWWVAEAGVKDVSRHNGKTTITLHNNISIPVSRGRIKELRAANWL